MIKTIVVTYKSQRAMQRDIKNRERKGFTVMSVTRNGQGWGVAKTVTLGVVFLPLAIFGKKGDIFQVVYQYEDTKISPEQTAKAPKWLMRVTLFLVILLILLAIMVSTLPPVH
jgi:hypothetical protein